ncbi:MAG: hypothetical protein AB7Q00_14475 [Phycisphaerales bacterium]
MALARRQGFVTNAKGDILANASVEVRVPSEDNRLADLFSDRDGTTPIGNPLLTDAQGFYGFHVVGGAYTITYTKDAYTHTDDYVGIGTASEVDAEFLAGAFDVVVPDIAGRAAYNGQAAGFSALVESDSGNDNLPTVYYKLSNSSGDWSEGFTYGVIRATSALTFRLDALGDVIATGPVWDQPAPFAGTIVSWMLLADGLGTVELEVWKDTFANFPPTAADKISGSAPLVLSNQSKNQSSTLTGWSPNFAQGDILRFNMNNCLAITKLTVVLFVRRS